MKKFSLLVTMGIAILPQISYADNGVSELPVLRNSVPLDTDEAPLVAYADSTVSLQEATVSAHFAKAGDTPLNLTTLTPTNLRLHAAPNYLMMFQGLPGVYATASTGSYGDASLNMRGFKQENIGVLLNGIPIMGLTSGSMYWSNWMGLAEATHAVQVQKGIGGSMLVDCAMGGMVNIVTKTAGTSPQTDLSISHAQWGTEKYSVGYSTGELPRGWSVNARLAYTQGNGYVETTGVETLSYLLTVGKRLGTHHNLVFTALGSPEQHDQRNTELSAAEVETYGRDYSKNWGLRHGKALSIGHNHYAKPYFTLQHFYDKDRLSLQNALYLAIADGGGTSTVSAAKPNLIDIQTADGHIDFAAIEAANQTTTDAEGRHVGQYALIDYLSGHTQAGGVVSGALALDDHWTVKAGVQYQYYDTWSKMVILDLLGADYLSYYKQPYALGDYIGSRYGRTTHHVSGFAQGVFTTDRLSAQLGASVFNGNYRRHNDATGETSAWAHGVGASVKTGVILHLSPRHDLYANGGYNSRLPYAGVYLASSDLSITNDITNETNIMAEAGWRGRWMGGGIEVSGYLASWRNKTLTVSLAKRADATAEKYQIKGLNAFHQGLEMTAYQRILPTLKVSAYASLGSWKWQNSGRAIVYDTYSNATLKEYEISCDGLHVGDAPQTQVGAKVDAKLPGGFYAQGGWQYNARMYADFEPSSRTAADTSDAYRFPAYNLLDATFGWRGSLTEDVRLDLFIGGTNLLDTHYIERGTDGATHDLTTFRGYWGQARTISLGLRLAM